MTKRYVARWATETERRLYNGFNGIIDDKLDERIICATGNVATAERIAAALTLVERVFDDELKGMAKAIRSEMET
jgi:hypothetical protein